MSHTKRFGKEALKLLKTQIIENPNNPHTKQLAELAADIGLIQRKIFEPFMANHVTHNQDLRPGDHFYYWHI